jgi:hypothetical protein
MMTPWQYWKYLEKEIAFSSKIRRDEQINAFFDTLMYGVYITGSIGTAFYWFTAYLAQMDKDDGIREFLDTNFDLDIDGIDIGALAPQHILFAVWNYIDAIGVAASAVVDFRNSDYLTSAVHTLNASQLTLLTTYGFALEAGNETATGIKETVDFGFGNAGFEMAAGAFALCMFLCALTARIKRSYIEDLMKKIDTLDLAPGTQIATIVNIEIKNNLISRLNIILRARYNGTVTLDTETLTIRQAQWILDTERTALMKSEDAWIACGIAMSVVFVVTCVFSGGTVPAFACFLVTTAGLLYSAYKRRELKNADAFASKEITDLTGAKGFENNKHLGKPLYLQALNNSSNKQLPAKVNDSKWSGPARLITF